MADIAYVDHSYHRTTRSTMFLPQLLESHGHDVAVFWDEAWQGGEPVSWERVSDRDVVIMFQSTCPIEGGRFRSLHPNVIFIPMFDQFGLSGDRGRDLTGFWEPFHGCKVLSFSAYVHAWATGAGIASRLLRYYPEPSPDRCPDDGLHGFFWVRRELELGWPVVSELIGSTSFDSFHVHLAGDPGFPPVSPPPEADLERHAVTVSSWFEDREDLDGILRRANVYFAPRLSEGIGQSFLEAMGRGQCVVAPDGPTMNEYIVDKVNGLLFDPRSPRPLDFSAARRLGAAARGGVLAGRARWTEGEQSLLHFILEPSATFYSAGDAVADGSPGLATARGRLAAVARSLAGTAKARVSLRSRA